MQPTLIEIGDWSMATYGLTAALAWLGSLALTAWMGVRRGHDFWFMLEITIGTAIAGVVGSRLWYVVQHADRFAGDWGQALNMSTGGLVYVPGFLAACVWVLAWSARNGKNIWDMADIIVLAGSLSMGIARWGCFASGCCYGRPTELPWGVTFTHPDSLAPLGIALHPTQVYLAVGNLILTGWLVWRLENRQWRGQVLVHYLIIYSVFRSLVELVRGDAVRGYLFELNLWGDAAGELLTTSQTLSLGMIAAGLWVIRRNRSEGLPAGADGSAAAGAASGGAGSKRKGTKKAKKRGR